MAQKTIPELNPLVGIPNDNTLIPIDTGTQSFKATAKQMKDYIVAGALVDIENLQDSELSSRRSLGFNTLSDFKTASATLIAPNVYKNINDIIWVDAWKIFVACYQATNATNDQLFSFSGDGVNWLSTGHAGRTNGFSRLVYNPTTNKVVALSSVGSGTNVAILTFTGSAITVTYQTATFDSGNFTDGVDDIKWIASQNAMFVACPRGKIFKSTNGTSFNLLKATDVSLTGNSKISAGKGNRVIGCCNSGTNRVYYSDDGGATWINSTVSVAGFTVNNVAYSIALDRYVISGSHASNISSCMYSDDAVTFIPCSHSNIPVVNDYYFSDGVISIEDFAMFFGAAVTGLCYSIDGATFKFSGLDQAINFSFGPRIVVGNGRVVIAYNDTTPKIIYSKMFKE